MGRHVNTFDIERNFFNAENMLVSPGHRSRARHELMDHAEMYHDHEVWERIGLMLVEMYYIDDMTTQHSDHFVDKCPDEVFAKFANEPPAGRFKGWHRRAIDMGLRKKSSPRREYNR